MAHPFTRFCALVALSLMGVAPAVAGDAYVQVAEIWQPNWAGRWVPVRSTNEAWVQLAGGTVLLKEGLRFDQSHLVQVERARVAFHLVAADGSEDWFAMLEGTSGLPASTGVAQKVGYALYRVAGRFVVESPTAIAGSESTRYVVIVDADGTTTVVAQEHTVTVSTADGAAGGERIEPGEVAVVSGGAVAVRDPTTAERRDVALRHREIDLLPTVSVGVLAGVGLNMRGRHLEDQGLESSVAMLVRVGFPGPLQFVATLGKVDTLRTTRFPLDAGIAGELGPIDLGGQLSLAIGPPCPNDDEASVFFGGTAWLGVRVPVSAAWDLEGRVQTTYAEVHGRDWTDASVVRVLTGVSRRF